MFKKGDEVEAVVLNIDVENERFASASSSSQADPVGRRSPSAIRWAPA